MKRAWYRVKFKDIYGRTPTSLLQPTKKEANKWIKTFKKNGGHGSNFVIEKIIKEL